MVRPAPFSNTPLTDDELNARTVNAIGDLDALDASVFDRRTLVSALSSWVAAQRFGRNVYVDQLNGNDANDGRSPQTAVKSLARAINIAGNYVNVYVIGTYVLNPPEYIPIINKFARILDGSGGTAKLIIDNEAQGRRITLFNSLLELGIDMEASNTGGTGYQAAIYLAGMSAMKLRLKPDASIPNITINDYISLVAGGEPSVFLRVLGNINVPNNGKIAWWVNGILEVLYSQTTINGQAANESLISSLILGIARDESGYPINILHSRKL